MGGIQLIYDPKVVSYERLLETLISTLDPTLINRVGNDRGTQYRHGIYPHTTEQAAIAEQYLTRLQQKYDRPVVTELRDATVFWPAEEYHQQYLERKGQSAEKECDQKVRCYGQNIRVADLGMQLFRKLYLTTCTMCTVA